MAPSSSEENGLLVEQLNRQLGAAFGTSPSGRINIRELHSLLRSLVDLHVSYDGERQRLKGAESALAGGNQINNSDTTTKSASKLDQPETAEEHVDEAVKIPIPSKETPLVNGKDTVGTASSTENEAVDETSSHVGEQNTEDQTEESEPLNAKALQDRSSDFLAKSTSSSKGSGDESSHSRKGIQSSVSGSSKSALDRDRKAPKKPSDQIQARDDSTQTAPDFVEILEGCKSHLEAVKEELLSLKSRVQSQHEDTIKLAGALDNVGLRLSEQEPKVVKLETDTHCLGMLVSDYEVNFDKIEKHLERHDVRVREFEWAFQRLDKERDALRADLRAVSEQVNYLSTVKADKVDVQTEMNRRALVTDMQQRVPYDTFNEAVRELSRTVTQVREELHVVDENLKTVQYELVKGLGAKASAQDVSQIRKQLVGALSRWQKLEKDQKCTPVVLGDFASAAVAGAGSPSLDPGAVNCLTCGIQTTLEGSRSVVPLPAKFVSSSKVRNLTRNVGGFHTRSSAPEKVFRTGSLVTVKKVPQDGNRTDPGWKL